MGKLICAIRKIAIPITPEEVVRQKILHMMTTSLGYSSNYFSVEQSLHAMPHLQNVPKSFFPKRRADILFFSKDLHPEFSLYPLLLIECKATKLNDKAINQVMSYNFFLKAPFIAIANAEEFRLGFQKKNGTYEFREGIPHFNELRASF